MFSCSGRATLIEPQPLMNHLLAQTVKNLPAVQETQVWSLGQEDPLEKGMATHSSILAWIIPWTEDPGGLQSMGSQRVGHNWVTNAFTFSLLPLKAGWEREEARGAIPSPARACRHIHSLKLQAWGEIKTKGSKIWINPETACQQGQWGGWLWLQHLWPFLYWFGWTETQDLAAKSGQVVLWLWSQKSGF